MSIADVEKVRRKYMAEGNQVPENPGVKPAEGKKFYMNPLSPPIKKDDNFEENLTKREDEWKRKWDKAFSQAPAPKTDQSKVSAETIKTEVEDQGSDPNTSKRPGPGVLEGTRTQARINGIEEKKPLTREEFLRGEFLRQFDETGTFDRKKATAEANVDPQEQKERMEEERARALEWKYTGGQQKETPMRAEDTVPILERINKEREGGKFNQADNQQQEKPAVQPTAKDSNIPPVKTELDKNVGDEGSKAAIPLDEIKYPEKAEEVAPAEKLSRARIEIQAKSIASEKHPDRNEDSIFKLPEKNAFGVFDGMGGAAAGDVASRIARDYVEDNLKKIPDGLSLEQTQAFLKKILTEANQKVSDGAAKDSKLAGMGTTASVVKIWEGQSGELKAVIGNVGDSRAYKMSKDGMLEQITLDDNLSTDNTPENEAREIQAKLNNIVDPSTLSVLERIFYERRNVITQALGSEFKEARIKVVDISAGDKIIVTCDGIHDNLTDKEIAEVLGKAPNIQKAVEDLVEAARVRSRDKAHPRSKQDDMSAIVAKVSEEGEPPKEALNTAVASGRGETGGAENKAEAAKETEPQPKTILEAISAEVEAEIADKIAGKIEEKRASGRGEITSGEKLTIAQEVYLKKLEGYSVAKIPGFKEEFGRFFAFLSGNENVKVKNDKGEVIKETKINWMFQHPSQELVDFLKKEFENKVRGEKEEVALGPVVEAIKETAPVSVEQTPSDIEQQELQKTVDSIFETTLSNAEAQDRIFGEATKKTREHVDKMTEEERTKFFGENDDSLDYARLYVKNLQQEFDKYNANLPKENPTDKPAEPAPVAVLTQEVGEQERQLTVEEATARLDEINKEREEKTNPLNPFGYSENQVVVPAKLETTTKPAETASVTPVKKTPWHKRVLEILKPKKVQIVAPAPKAPVAEPVPTAETAATVPTPPPNRQ